MKKNVILILTAVFVFIVFGLLVSYGFFSPYNYFTAKPSIYTRQFKKIIIEGHPVYDDIEQYVGKKYGIDVIISYQLFFARPIYYNGIKVYNEVMEENFKKLKGEKLYKQYIHELDSISLSKSPVM